MRWLELVGRIRNRQHTIRQRDWSPVPTAALQPYMRYARSDRPFGHVDPTLDDPALNASFTYYNHAPQHAYLYHVQRPVLIEPTLGYAIFPPHHIILESMPYSWHGGMPSFMEHAFRMRQGRHHIQHMPKVISLRDFGDGNYYHFYNDVLAKLGLLRACGITADFPLLVSRRLVDTPYFQAALQRGPLKHYHWMVHDDQIVLADEVVFCKTMPHIRHNFDTVLAVLDAPVPPSSQKRIFLTRDPRRGRYITNSEQVERICRRFGFAVVDADQLALDEQITVFASARYVIGIHGAGLVNLMFRRDARLSLLELFPSDNLPPHYFWLCHTFGFRYHALRGTTQGDPRGFFVEPSQLEAHIEAMLMAE